MIIGSVINRRPLVHLTVRGPGGQDQDVEFVLDTGFTGFLTLPSAAVAALMLPFVQYYRGILADGRVTRLEVYAATVFWDGAERDVHVLAMGSAPLVGMSLMNGSDVRLQVTDGGLVTIESL